MLPAPRFKKADLLLLVWDYSSLVRDEPDFGSSLASSEQVADAAFDRFRMEMVGAFGFFRL